MTLELGIADHPGDDRLAVPDQRLLLRQGRRCAEAAAAATALVFPSRPELFLLGAIAIMAAGGLSVLLEIFPRLGAFVLTLFLVPAALIHCRKGARPSPSGMRH